LDYNVGFGGKYGVQKEEPSRLAASTTPPSGKSILPVFKLSYILLERKMAEKPTPPVGSSVGVGNIRAR
jgi:hypothetical protein